MLQNRRSIGRSVKPHRRRPEDRRAEVGRRSASWAGWWITAVVAIGIAALALRLTYLAELSHSPFFSVLIGDGQEYDAWAQ